jgi:hypothetical protein
MPESPFFSSIPLCSSGIAVEVSAIHFGAIPGGGEGCSFFLMNDVLSGPHGSNMPGI